MLTEEVEIKLAVAPEKANRLLKLKIVRKHRNGKPSRRRLVSTYYDTPHHMLRKAGMALRIRDDGKKTIQTLKLPSNGPVGLQNSAEFNSTISLDGPSLEQITDPGLCRFISKKRLTNDRLTPVFTTDIIRTTLDLKHKNSRFKLALDQGEIQALRKGKIRTETISEVEFELISGSVLPMLDLVLDVCEKSDVLPSHLTKARRGYALARKPLRPKPRKATPISLDPDMVTGDAFLLAIGEALEQLFENRVPLLTANPSAIHQTRVAMRRLRAIMRAFKIILPYHERKAFNGEFRWFQQRMSAARDWHVFLNESIPLVTAWNPLTEKDYDKLVRIARQERRRATAEAIEYVQSRRYTRLIIQFERWLADIRKHIPDKDYNQPVCDFAIGVLNKTTRDFLKEKRSLSRLPAEDLHTLRKYGKKARYATSIFCSLWENNQVKPYLKLMSKIQNQFGDVNDAVVARDILWTVTPARQDPELAIIVQKWSQQRVKRAIRTATPSWRKFKQSRPFWEEI